MKNYFKKFSIMFVMLLAVVGVGVIQNGTVANAATVGQQLTQPEDGWKRYDDSDSRIQNNSTSIVKSEAYNSSLCLLGSKNDYVKFKFKGTKLRIIGATATAETNYGYPGGTFNIDIDGVSYSFSNLAPMLFKALVFEKLDLDNSIHSVNITNPTGGYYLWLDAIDINNDGYLVNNDESIILNSSTMNLTIGDSNQSTATTTPAGSEVVWASSDSTIATVDSTGKVTAIKEGQAIITAQIKDSETKATCTVNVTAGGTTEPTDPISGTGLFIELVDGNIKQYDVSSDEINKFISWYNNRDNDDSQPPYYKFAKGTYKDYVVHDKIDWFEIR